MMNHRMKRRRFLGTAAAVATPLVVSSRALGLDEKQAASERISVGVVGLGSRGFNLLDALLEQGDVEVVALCDVDRQHYRDRPWGRGAANGLEPAREYVSRHSRSSSAGGIFTTTDYRQLIERPDLDAIVVATPDHWHALCTLAALQAGQDVYCEKPLTHTFAEGQRIYRAAAERNAVFQTGSQQRSDPGFRAAVQLAHSGRLGRIERVEVGLPPGYAEAQGDPTPTQPPQHLDYQMWTGPAPLLPYMRARHHRWWRGSRAYGGGVLMDWIGHHNDIAHWALGLDKSGPVRVEAVDWTFPETDVYDTPHQYTIRCEYRDGATGTISSRNSIGTRIVGTDGWVHVDRGRLSASDPQWLEALGVEPRWKFDSTSTHVRDFLDCIKSRKECIAPAETAHRSITPGHLAYASQQLGRPLRWDPESETAVEDDEANRLLQQIDYRQPWSLEG